MFEPLEIEWFVKPLVGKVEMSITGHQIGRVQFRGTSWFARLDDPSHHSALQPGDLAMVLGREGCTTLVVMPAGNVLQQAMVDRSQTARKERKNGWFRWSWLAS